MKPLKAVRSSTKPTITNRGNSMSRAPRHNTELHEVIRNAPDLAQSSKQKYLRDLDAWIDFAGPNPVGWTRETAQSFYNNLSDRMRPQSANRLMSSVSYASRWRAHLHNNPNLDFGIVRKARSGEGEGRNSLTPETAIALLETTRDPTPINLRDRALIIVGLETGMRRMSLAGMAYENLKQAPYARIEVPIKGHGSDLFSVPLTDVAIEALTPWTAWLTSKRQSTREGAVFRRLWTTLDNKGKLTQGTRDSEAISEAMIHRVVARRATSANVGVVHPHLFRHSFVTWRSELGMPDDQIASVTGHSLTARTGAIGRYKDLLALGGIARATSPTWLVEWLRSVSV